MHKAPRSPPPYDVSICVRTSSSRPQSRVGDCSVIPTTMGKAAGAWLRESCTREGCVPGTRTSKFLSRPEGSPGRFVQLSGRMIRRILPVLRVSSPEEQTNRSTFSQENTSVGVKSSSLFIWRAVFAAWQRGSIAARLGSAFIIFRGSTAAASCV